VALLAFLAPHEASAQAATPQPQFSITGFIDTVGTWTQNFSSSDVNFNRNRDHQVYGRQRGRFDIVGEVGQAKAVFGFEIDAYWGQTGFIDSNQGPGCVTSGTISAVTCGATGTGAESSFDLNTDTQGSIQVKWLYTEFPLPLVPIPIVARLGAQPFATAANYKLGVYATGDFAGVNLYATFTPDLRAQFTYVALDENLLGKGAFGPVLPSTGSLQNKCITSTAVNIGGVSTAAGTVTGNCIPQSRGDNWAIIVSPEITLMKSLDIKPMFSTVFIDGVTSSAARNGRGGVNTAPGGPFAPTNSVNSRGSAGVAGADGAGTGVHEYRHTIGVDARWRSGPWSVDPTILYQFGSQSKWNQGGLASAYGTAGTRQSADISAWLGDFRASYQLGSLLLSAMTMFTTGQDAKSNPYKSIKYFQPLDTDTSYMADWGTQIISLGVDYYQITLGTFGTGIGFDKYGRVTSGIKASYAWTPALTVGAGVTPNWTWSKVDTDGIPSGPSAFLQPNFVCRKTLQTCRPQGESNFIGTEWNVALTYSLAPGLVFDWAFGYLQADSALAHRAVLSQYNAGAGAPIPKDIGVNPVAITTARVRFSF
jgi:hypothetical protein